MKAVNTRRVTKTLCDYPLLIGELLRRIQAKHHRRVRWRNRFQLRKLRFMRWRSTRK